MDDKNQVFITSAQERIRHILTQLKEQNERGPVASPKCMSCQHEHTEGVLEASFSVLADSGTREGTLYLPVSIKNESILFSDTMPPVSAELPDSVRFNRIRFFEMFGKSFAVEFTFDPAMRIAENSFEWKKEFGTRIA